jgi:F-type H+-transporting ATPase subunit b
MHLDWFTLVAQILNFFVLVWILKRFLYQPILKSMGERETHIRETIVQAEEEKKKAKAERVDLEHQNSEIAKQRDELLKQARNSAQEERQHLIEEARAEFEAARLKYQETLIREQHDLQQELSRQARIEVIAIAQRVLGDLADSEIQERMAHKFCQRLADLNDEEKNQLRRPLEQSPERIATIRHSVAMSPQIRETLQKSVTGILGDLTLNFENKPALGCGIELAVDGQKVAWSVDDYMRSLEISLNEVLTKKTQTNESRSEQPAAACA